MPQTRQKGKNPGFSHLVTLNDPLFCAIRSVRLDFPGRQGIILRHRNNIPEGNLMPVLDDYFSIVEAAQILGVHPGTMKRTYLI